MTDKPETYLTYAARHIASAIAKAEDAPASSAQHEAQAGLALALGRIPTHEEALHVWTRPTTTSIVVAAVEGVQRYAEAVGRPFGIDEVLRWKDAFYAGAKWASSTPNADVDGPASTVAAAPPSAVALFVDDEIDGITQDLGLRDL